MLLRPHHLLCLQAFRGEGYNEEFVRHTIMVVKRLRRERGTTRITLTPVIDDVCTACPHKRGKHCRDEERIAQYDKNVRQLFNLNDQEYNFGDAMAIIRRKITPELLYKICGDCCWYEICSEVFAAQDDQK